jgi:hypothetical protein
MAKPDAASISGLQASERGVDRIAKVLGRWNPADMHHTTPHIK